MNFPASISENHGIANLHANDLQVFSVGISTGGIAEIRMAEAQPDRHIVATTLDEEGLIFAKNYITERGLAGQIEVELEDVSEPLPYPDGHFDYIYARLVFHYLSEERLRRALAESRRILRSGGRLFAVVRSTECPDATRPEAHYDPATKLTSCTFTDEKTGKTHSYSRYFHTERSIRDYVTEAGFTVAHIDSYDEHLYVDFMRTKLSPQTDNVIEVLATKPA